MNTSLVEDYNLVYEAFFNSSHFIYGYELKEELHGHNYSVTFHVKAPCLTLNEKFLAKIELICSEMNNRVIIAKDCETVHTDVSENEVMVNLNDKNYYRLPRMCCYIMNEINSTAECIARHFFDETVGNLDHGWEKVMVTVAEIYQQQEAIYRVSNVN